MIIITADDYGKTEYTTDSILQCFSSKRITSASAMVYMKDSERAATLALQTDMEMGLHINFTMPFSAVKINSSLREHHNRAVSYLIKNKLTQIIYNPLLANSFNFLFNTQLDEFVRLYGRQPDFYNGHHHMHLCTNMLIGHMLPKGVRVRTTFTFNKNEKNLFNRFYRRILENIVSKRFISTDNFFSILPLHDYERLRNIFNRSVATNIEIEVHPENAGEMDFLLSTNYSTLIASAKIGNFKQINKKTN